MRPDAGERGRKSVCASEGNRYEYERGTDELTTNSRNINITWTGVWIRRIVAAYKILV